jgi:glycosyltransferase involved in cell wall biosynthesis
MAEALVAQGYQVEVLCLQLPGHMADEMLGGVRVVRLPETRHQGSGLLAYLKEYARFFFLAGAELRRRHRAEPYAVVQVHNPPDALIFCTLALWFDIIRRRVRVVLDLRELVPELFMSRFGLARGGLVVQLLTLVERLSCGYASAVFVLHERHRRIMLARGVPAGKLVQVMNCPDERIFGTGPFAWQSQAESSETRASNQAGGSWTVLNHGGIFQRYGVDVLVQAIALARPEIPGLRLELYGAGDYRPELERLIDSLDLREIVRLHGQRPIEEMPAAIAAANVGVAPLRQDVFTDCGLPTKLLEYVMLGVPAIASRTATTADYFDDSTVLLFKPGDAADLAAKLVATYRDPAAARERAELARSFTDQHNWRGESRRYLQTIDSLL